MRRALIIVVFLAGCDFAGLSRNYADANTVDAGNDTTKNETAPDLAHADATPTPTDGSMLDMVGADLVSCTGCQPGDVQTSPDGCETRTCSPSCTWSTWMLKSGATCVTGTQQSCNAGVNCPTQGTQQCVTCQWAACTC